MRIKEDEAMKCDRVLTASETDVPQDRGKEAADKASCGYLVGRIADIVTSDKCLSAEYLERLYREA